mmetsp:Transcript_100688/g.260041  ORF Transcript_100688/g.260041 Transcript_100688/m.260041 type:complete len:279 (+) Transcript_100688:61-897(+)
MVFIEESRSFWPLFPLQRSFSGDRKLSRSNSSESSDPEDKDDARSWDIAESVERGLARELTADFLCPLAKSHGFHRFRVERSTDRLHFRVYRESGEFLMFASAAKDFERINIYTYDPQTDDSLLYDPDRPAFTMALSQSRTDYQLVQERCDRCRHCQGHTSCNCGGQQDLMCVSMSRQEVGDGTNYRMSASLGDKVPLCRLVTKSPRWDKKLECMVLNFKGRKVHASAKNFQLTLKNDPDTVICQHGKIAPDTFALDCRSPLTFIQAFGASLATMDWQ